MKTAILALAGAIALTAPGPMVRAQEAPAVRQAPGFYRAMLGGFRITALSDGTTPQPFDEVLHVPAPERYARSLENAGVDAHRETSVNVYLIDTGERQILVDAGAGGVFGPCCGRLPEVLAVAGYSPADIDAVLLTHVHGDHSGGLSRDGRAVFPNAEIHVAKAELDYWMSDASRASAKPNHQPWFALGRADLAPYVSAGRVRTFGPDVEILPGVRALAAPGHTAGHTVFEIESQGSRMLVIGDLIHFAEVQLPDPSITIDYDDDEAEATETRLRLLNDLADSHELVAAPHVSFPGLGRVSREGAGFGWAPIPYSGQVRDLDGPAQPHDPAH
jgi:glyoxylase-like metal-dependent hydrolase (beta-lactamase superfamily II)